MHFPKYLFCIIGLFILLSGRGYSQTVTQVPAVYEGLPWQEFVQKMEAQFPLRIFYDSAEVAAVLIQLPAGEASLEAVLRKTFSGSQQTFAQDQQGNWFITALPAIKTELPDKVFEPQESAAPDPVLVKQEQEEAEFMQTRKEMAARQLVVGDPAQAGGSRQVVLSGYLINIEDGGSVIGASVAIPELKLGTTSNQSGFFSLNLPKGNYTLLIRSLNFKEASYELSLYASGQLKLELAPKLLELEGVEVTARRDNPVKNTQMGYERLSISRIKEIPLVLGEADIIKVAQLLPGIQSVGEGAAGFNVRGSPADQNLFYLNKVPIYNTSHVFGFFSAFNSDAIRDFALSKSNIPAKFGGRLASIFDVTAKTGNKRKYTASGGISPITGRVLVEGPIQKEKSSFAIGLRSTYSDWLLEQVPNPDYQNSSARFVDGIGNFAFEFGENNRLNLFGYYSADRFNFAGRTDYDYENVGGSATWTRFFNQKHNLDLSLIYSKYSQEVGNSESLLEAYLQNNSIEHREARLDFTFRPNNQHQVEIGANAIRYEVDRGSFLPLGEASQWESLELGLEQSVEGGIYISEQWDVSDRLTLNGGLRYNFYRYLGPQSVFEYQNGGPRNENTISDTLSYGKNADISTYTGLDYRAAVRYLISPTLSIKGSVNRLHQYIFLLSNTIALAPNDKWKLSDSHIEPMTGNQYSLGLYTQLMQNKLEVSLEGYYKDVDKLVQYRDGADLLINASPEQEVLQGDLSAYGVEFMVKKPFGRINGWVNYTYSRSTVQVNSDNPAERINFGNAYPADYDKPHAVNVVGNFKFSRRLSFSGNMVYATGRPITYPTTVYYQNGLQLINYSARNEYRIPDYFRVDMSLRLEGNLRSQKLLHGSWVLSVYNLTGRQNAYSVYFTSQQSTITGYRVSIFGAPIFSLTYDFKFGNYAN